MQQGRTLLAIALSMFVIFAYYTWVEPPKPAMPVSAIADIQKPTDTPVQTPAKENGSKNLPIFQSNPSAQKVGFENSKVQAEISVENGALTGWMLKDYDQDVSKNSPKINLVEGKPNLILTTGLKFLDDAPAFKLVNQKNEVGAKTIKLETSKDGLIFTKAFTLKEDQSPYVMDVEAEFKNDSASPLQVEPRLWLYDEQKQTPSKGGFFSFLSGPQPDLYYPLDYKQGKVETYHDVKKLALVTENIGPILWNGITDRYFLLGLVSRQESQSTSVRFGIENQKKVYTSLSYGAMILQPGESVKKRYTVYLGPKMREDLQHLGIGLEQSVDYGWFGLVAIPLLNLLIFFEKVIKNWGLAIILLTFVVKMILHPINKKSMQSMKAMQKIQPKLKEIQVKYKGDREKLNIEMMGLFKAHKVNPMGGCLPMLVQMPVYIALYKVLWNAIELYHAPFFGPYKDLSAADPYFIGPLLLGVLFYFQQKFTPTSASVDPAQQKVMQFMPVMFTAFMIFLPSGLVLYIFVNTLMSVIQQYMIHNDMTFVGLFRKLRGEES